MALSESPLHEVVFGANCIGKINRRKRTDGYQSMAVAE
jgi:hypothetical protein